jgi:hypothetical protein
MFGRNVWHHYFCASQPFDNTLLPNDSLPLRIARQTPSHLPPLANLLTTHHPSFLAHTPAPTNDLFRTCTFFQSGKPRPNCWLPCLIRLGNLPQHQVKVPKSLPSRLTSFLDLQANSSPSSSTSRSKAPQALNVDPRAHLTLASQTWSIRLPTHTK